MRSTSARRAFSLFRLTLAVVFGTSLLAGSGGCGGGSGGGPGGGGRDGGGSDGGGGDAGGGVDGGGDAAATTRTEVTGQVRSVAGAALAGVTVTIVGASGSATTDAAGAVALVLDPGRSHTVKLSKAGFADQFKIVDLPSGAKNAAFQAEMLPREAAQSLADASAGGTLRAADGAKLELPPGALADAAGNAVMGAVQIALTPVNVASSEVGGFPGAFQGTRANGASTPLVSYGTVEYVLSQDGRKVNLAAGKSATIELPLYVKKNADGSDLKAGQKIPLWSLDESTAIWKQEGEGEVVANPASPTGLALRATVTHFSWWNCDDVPGPEARISMRCKLLDAENRPTIDLAPGETCLVEGEVPDPAVRPIQRATEILDAQGRNERGEQSFRIPAGTTVELRAQGPRPTLRGFTTVNVPEGTTSAVVLALHEEVPITLVTPEADAVLPAQASATALVTAGAKIARPDKVELYLGGVKVAEDTTAPYEFSFATAAAPEGWQSIDARAIIGSFVVGVSQPRRVGVDRTPRW